MNIDLSKVISPVVPPPVDTPKVTFVDDKPVAGKKSFYVQLEGEPKALIEGVEDRLEAMEVYNKQLGILHTTRKYTYEQA